MLSCGVVIIGRSSPFSLVKNRLSTSEQTILMRTFYDSEKEKPFGNIMRKGQYAGDLFS